MVRPLAFLFLFLPAPVFCDASAAISVFGHKIPDTDAICAAIVYSWELQSRGIPANAYRLGELNPETEYVLRSLGIDAPPLLGELGKDERVAIVDTNNPEELPEGVEQVKGEEAW